MAARANASMAAANTTIAAEMTRIEEASPAKYFINVKNANISVSAAPTPTSPCFRSLILLKLFVAEAKTFKATPRITMLSENLMISPASAFRYFISSDTLII